LKTLAVAIEEARTGLSEGGIPIGAALVDKNEKVPGRGQNRRVQFQIGKGRFGAGLVCCINNAIFKA